MPRDVLALLVIVLGIFPAFLSLFFPGMIGLGDSPFEFVNSKYSLAGSSSGEHDNYFTYMAPKDPAATLAEITAVEKPLEVESVGNGAASSNSAGGPDGSAGPPPPEVSHVLSYREGAIAVGPPRPGYTGATVILASPRQAQIMYGRHVHVHLTNYRAVSWRSGRVFRGGSFMGGK